MKKNKKNYEKYKWIILGILINQPSKEINKFINPYLVSKYGINIANHLLNDGYVPINSRNNVNPESVIYYDLPYIDDLLFDVIQKI